MTLWAPKMLKNLVHDLGQCRKFQAIRPISTIFKPTVWLFYEHWPRYIQRGKRVIFSLSYQIYDIKNHYAALHFIIEFSKAQVFFWCPQGSQLAINGGVCSVLLSPASLTILIAHFLDGNSAGWLLSVLVASTRPFECCWQLSSPRCSSSGSTEAKSNAWP